MPAPVYAANAVPSSTLDSWPTMYWYVVGLKKRPHLTRDRTNTSSHGQRPCSVAKGMYAADTFCAFQSKKGSCQRYSASTGKRKRASYRHGVLSVVPQS